MGLDGDADDYGLPKVDVVIPDDARELERDVIAYRRELRQKRRRARWRRLGRPFTRYGIAAPFIASAVLIALISGVLMTVISPRPARQTTQIPPTGPEPSEAGRVGGTLPSGELNTDVGPYRLLDMHPAVLAIVPSGCGCDRTIDRLSRQANRMQVQLWLIADGRAGHDADDVRGLAQTAAHRLARVVEDPDRLLATAFHPSGLTAIFVHTDRIVGDIIPNVAANTDFTPHIGPLREPGEGLVHS